MLIDIIYCKCFGLISRVGTETQIYCMLFSNISRTKCIASSHKTRIAKIVNSS
jgi:hypothetical protein